MLGLGIKARESWWGQYVSGVVGILVAGEWMAVGVGRRMSRC